MPEIKEELEKAGHIITLPNGYDNPFREERIKQRSQEEHVKFKREMFRLQIEKIEENEGALALNFDKNGQKNYIGSSTFLEMYDIWRLNKRLFLYNHIPKGILEDELTGFNPTIINGDLSQIK